jgi:hypothetical protein
MYRTERQRVSGFFWAAPRSRAGGNGQVQGVLRFFFNTCLVLSLTKSLSGFACRVNLPHAHAPRFCVALALLWRWVDRGGMAVSRLACLPSECTYQQIQSSKQL